MRRTTTSTCRWTTPTWRAAAARLHLLSPGFRKGGDVTFLLTDGQMELVDLDPDFDFFEAMLGGASYVT